MFVCVLDVLSSVSRVAASVDKFRGPPISVLRLKSNVGSPPPACRHSTLKNEMGSINWSSKAGRVRRRSLHTLIADQPKGDVGRVPRGYKTNRVPEIPLSREDIVVHPAAREAFAYFRHFVENRHVARGLPQVVPPQLEFICENTGNDSDAGEDGSRYMEHRFLVGGFHQVALLSDTCKLKCRVADHEFVCDADIEDYAWQQVLLCESFRRSSNKSMAARFCALIRSLPERLVGRLLARDPESSDGTKLETESLCRAYRLRSNSIRRHMPVVQRGGIETHTYADHTAKKDTDDE